jgi:hypothetical protein
MYKPLLCFLNNEKLTTSIALIVVKINYLNNFEKTAKVKNGER